MNNIWDINWRKGIRGDIHPELINIIVKYAKKGKVLEIGFGSGGDLSELSKKGFDCVGVETSKVAFDFAQKQNLFKAFFQNGEKTSFKDSEFDVVFHQGVLEHFKNPKMFIQEQRRILKDDGLLIIDVPHKLNLFTVYKNIRMFFNNWYGGWERSYTARELKDLLKRFGFETVKIEYRGIWPHRWGKLIFPERIIKRKWVGRILSAFPINLIQKLVRKVYDSYALVRLLSSYNLIIVGKKRPMRVGFDARYAEGDLVGVGKYIRSLILELSNLGIKCVLFYSTRPKTEIKGRNIKSVVLNSKNRYLFEQIYLPRALKKEGVDLYHALGNIGVPIFCPVPSVLTVHDIIPLEIKDYFSYSPAPFLSKASYLVRLKTSLLRAKRIVTDSVYVKERLVRFPSISKKKIIPIYLGPLPVGKGDKLPGVLVGEKYILNQSGIDIRKNQDILIKAFALVVAKHKNIKLVITGRNPTIRKKLDILVNRLGLNGKVIFPGYLKDSVFDAVLREALIICYPSLSEGFGFSILEGFAAGVPVISSNTTSMPEIAGKAALLVDPNNVNEIAGAIEKLLVDKKLRENMVLKGKAQYNKFSWRKTANEYIRLYNSI